MGRGTNATVRRAATVAAVVGGSLLVGVCLWLWWHRPPPMGSDKDVFRTVDALFTAITARDETRLADCETRLHTLRDRSQLPPAAATYLDGIIGTARAGDWQSAAERLYEFISAQPRDRSQLSGRARGS